MVVKIRSNIFFDFLCFDIEGVIVSEPLTGSTRCRVLSFVVDTEFRVSEFSWIDRRARGAPSTWVNWMANTISKARTALLNIEIMVSVILMDEWKIVK